MQAWKEKQLNPRKPDICLPRVLSPQPSLTADGAAHRPGPAAQVQGAGAHSRSAGGVMRNRTPNAGARPEGPGLGFEQGGLRALYQVWSPGGVVGRQQA